MAQPTRQAGSRRERLFLLDGMALAYRAYFSFISRPLINSKGENTSAIFGFVNTLMKILNEDRPDHLAVVFDTKEPTFRHIMYDQYKATREKMPEDMAGQLDKLKEVVQAFNVPTIELPGYEADDIMGTLARKAERQGIETYLVTGDKDFMQLISPLVKIYKPGKQGEEWEILDETAVMSKFGVEPAQVIDVLGLIGDKSDNVPGVYGVGEKSAIPLVRQYGSVEKIIEHLDDIPQQGLRQKIRDNLQNAILSKKLVTIDTRVPIDVDLHHLTAKEKDRPKLLKLFAELEFRNLLKKLSDDGSPEPAPPPVPVDLKTVSSEPHTYHLVTTAKELDALVKRLKRSKLFCFDTETTSTDAMSAELLGLSFALEPGEAWYVPVRPHSEGAKHHEGGLFAPGAGGEVHTAIHPSHDEAFPLERIVASLSPLFADPKITKVGQNVKYDMLILARHGIATEGVCFDTMVANYVLRPEGQHGMDAMAVEHLGYRPISYDDLTGTGRERKELVEIDLAAIAEYAAEDADVTLRLYHAIRAKLEAIGLLHLCEELEFPLIPVLAGMEQTGVALDLPFLAGLSKEMERILDRLTREICADAGETFNINSTKQLSKILFEKLKIGRAHV
jgi:DNA polymerase-1